VKILMRHVRAQMSIKVIFAGERGQVLIGEATRKRADPRSPRQESADHDPVVDVTRHHKLFWSRCF
jgi:hypothetical protein